MNTTDYLLQFFDGNQPALLTPKNKYSYQELRHAIQALMDAFYSAGLRRGERVGILGNNSLFWVASYLATIKWGGIAVPLTTKSTPGELVAQIEHTDCKVLCAEKFFFRKYSAALSSHPCRLDEDALSTRFTEDWPAAPPDFDDNQDAAWMLTSGTTAKPRIVRVTHANIQANTDSIVQYLNLTSADRMMVILPFYYCYGISLLHTHLRAGGSLVLGDTVGFPEKVLDILEETQCTGFAGVPTTFQMYLRNSTFPNRALKSLRHIQQAGGKLSNVLITELTQCRPGVNIFTMYGQTEATARLSYLPPDLLASKLGSIGRGIPAVQLRVLKEDGAAVNPGEVGEIVAWGKNISPGYWNEPEANAKKFVNGSLRTGDMATVDEDGFIYIVDRKDDFIKSYGNRVSSQEIEACILEIKDIVAVAVVGVPDLARGEAIRAFIVLRSNANLTEKTIVDHCKQRLARYMVPRDIIFIKGLPTNAHGKVVKTELKKMEVT